MVEIMTGKELKQLRDKHGMTQAQLATELGYMTKGKANLSVISRWENDRQAIGRRAELALQGLFYMRGE